MEQRTHAWIAIRAIAYLEERKANPGLVKLLKPSMHAASMGAWIPDLADAKRGGGNTQHHVFKLLPYEGANASRFVAKKADLLKRLTGSPATRAFIKADKTLSATWWATPFKADPPPGQHLANRATALAGSLRDLLVMGSKEVDKLLPGDVKFLDKLDDAARTQREQAALYLFMLSHFIADACMPMHCDGRMLAGFSNGLHEQLEDHWKELVGKTFSDESLAKAAGNAAACKKLLDDARAVDECANLSFKDKLPDLPHGRDVWKEIVDVCRASFALSAVIAPPEDYPYASKKARAPFKKVLEGKELLEEVDRLVLEDAVVNTAMIWSAVWVGAAGREWVEA